MFRIAIAGAGLIGQAHLKALQAQTKARLAAIIDPDPKTKAQAESLGVPYFTELKDALPHCDGVVLATPNHLHLAHAMMCIEAGVPCLLEKPLTANLEEGEALLKAQQIKQAKILVGHHRAHSPIVQESKQIAQSGQLGRLVAYQGSATFYKPAHYFVQGPWRTKKGAGPILLNMIHEVHTMRSIMGEIKAVQAIASNEVRGFEVEDTVVINLEFVSGALGSFVLSDTIAASKSWEQTSGENPQYPSYPNEDCYQVMGTKGTLSVPSMQLKTYSGEPDWWLPFTQTTAHLVRTDPIQNQMQHFIEVVAGKAEPLVTVADGLANLRVTEAIRQAAASQLKIAL